MVLALGQLFTWFYSCDEHLVNFDVLDQAQDIALHGNLQPFHNADGSGTGDTGISRVLLRLPPSSKLRFYTIGEEGSSNTSKIQRTRRAEDLEDQGRPGGLF